MEKNRLEAYADNIFSIVATLMIFNLHLQDGLPVGHALQAEVPKIAVFFFSFMILGMYWVAHHSLFHFVARSDRSLLWRNNFFLMFISFVPFPANVLGDHPLDPDSICLYGAALICVNLSMFFMWRGIITHCLINRTKAEITPQIRRNMRILQLGPVGAYMLAMALSFSLPQASLAIFVAVPLFYILPNAVLRRLLISEVS